MKVILLKHSPKLIRAFCSHLLVLLLSIFSSAIILADPLVPEAASHEAPNISPLVSNTDAVILGLIEGITEYLPVSSTGHLILADKLLGLRDPSLSKEQSDAVEAFEIIIQGGAILAVLYAYFARMLQMLQGLLGRDSQGRKLFFCVSLAVLPALTIGFLMHGLIKTYLTDEWTVIFALAAGGVAMILFERSSLAKKRRTSGHGIEDLTYKQALVIGSLQCFALWPGTSRSMMSILGGLTVGLRPVAAAEFSFLIGFPTLLAATGYKAIKYSDELYHHIGLDAMAIGMLVAGVSAFFCVKSLVAWLSKRGFEPFGWYRLVLATVMLIVLW
jgi:undecaprenyl-diphosphatase